MRADHLPTGQTRRVLPRHARRASAAAPTRARRAARSAAASTATAAITPRAADGLLYAVIPYNAVPGHCQSDNPRPNGSTADPTISTISHEHSEMVTDPVGDAWIDSSGSEDGDLCLTSFGPAIGGSGASAWNEDDQRRPLLPPGGVEQRRRRAASRAPSPTRSRSRRPAQRALERSLAFTAHGSDPAAAGSSRTAGSSATAAPAAAAP